MRRTISIIVCGFVLFVYGQSEIFRTKLRGMQVQAYNPGFEIDSLTVYQSGEWVFLRAWRISEFGDILGTKLKETHLQGAKPPVGYLTGFTASGPDAEGYVYLTAVSDGGFSANIIKTKWLGTATRTFSAPAGSCISGFTTTGPDAQGYVYLLVGTGLIGIEEEKGDAEERLEMITFGIEKISPNPCFDHARIFYSIARPSEVDLSIYDISGRLVKGLIATNQDRGRYNLSWGCVDEKNKVVPAGVYFVHLKATPVGEADPICITKKLLLTK